MHVSLYGSLFLIKFLGVLMAPTKACSVSWFMFFLLRVLFIHLNVFSQTTKIIARQPLIYLSMPAFLILLDYSCTHQCMYGHLGAYPLGWHWSPISMQCTGYFCFTINISGMHAFIPIDCTFPFLWDYSGTHNNAGDATLVLARFWWLCSIFPCAPYSVLSIFEASIQLCQYGCTFLM